MDRKPDYNKWTRDALVRRIQELEAAAAARNRTATNSAADDCSRDLKPNKKNTDKKIDPSRYTSRMVAFKTAYIGKNYAGFEFQASATMPTVEEELWKALVKACLIFPENPDEVQWDDWEYSKCGRTDRGVSAFGQVIALRVRSNRRPPKKEEEPFNDFVDEIQYCRVLNRLLPSDIRVLAWCPEIPAGFSARHDCRERQYRYFFTQPAYSPIPQSIENPKSTNSVKDGWLDIEAMRVAAKKFEGSHDFRNFCKIDPGKLLTNFDRNMFECDIVEVKDAETILPYLNRANLRPSAGMVGTDKFPKVYYFLVRGSAFLWHQIRCMVAVIFMVGQGLESPSIVDDLLDPEKYPRRPNYVLASEFPLVLWDCVFPDKEDAERKDTMGWVYIGEDSPLNKHGSFGLMDEMWEFWREKKMDEILSSQLLNMVAGLGDISLRRNPKAPQYVPLSQRVFEGADRERLVGKYQPVVDKVKLPTPEESYDKQAKRKGYASANAWREVRKQKYGAAAAAAAAEVETASLDICNTRKA